MNTEKEWTTESGYAAKVLTHPAGHRCGYVMLPENHPCYGKEYGDVDGIDVHGGLTYSYKGMFGFDCSHWGDAKDPSITDPTFIRIDLEFDRPGTIKTLDFCITECESMAKQFKAMENA
jgi:hypothetical protein